MTENPGKSRRVKRAVTVALILVVLVMLFMLVTVCGCAQTITGKVVGGSDGDTLTILDASNKQQKVRLDGIDASQAVRVEKPYS
jgi:endonuclease YncB( thermonuclease family)